MSSFIPQVFIVSAGSFVSCMLILLWTMQKMEGGLVPDFIYDASLEVLLLSFFLGIFSLTISKLVSGKALVQVLFGAVAGPISAGLVIHLFI